MKKKLIALVLMFAFAFPFTAQAADKSPRLMVPAYEVEQNRETMQAEAKESNNAAIAANKYRQSGAVAASIKETTSNDAWEDRYASIDDGSGGVSGGDSIGIGKVAT